MTMKFHRFLLLALLPITAMFAACNHDEGETMLELHAERFGGQKMTVQDSTGAWSEGDLVWINGQNYRISIDNNGHAVVSVPTAPSYNAVFPASIKRDGNKVCLPAEYHYTTEGGRQVLNLPMVASSDGSNGLFFNHLTGALIVKFTNDRSESVVVDRITVHCAHPLCGTFEISDTTLSPSGATDTSITMYFDRQEVLLANHNTIAVMLPIVPVDSAQFTVKVSCHVNGDRYSDSTRQANQHDFERNRLGYAFMKVEAGNSPGYLFEFTYPYCHIKNVNDFLLMHEAINEGWTYYGNQTYSSMSYILDNDIDMNGYEIEPISGYTGPRFYGGGQGHIIRNLTIKSNTAYCALFDIISGNTTLSNITLDNVHLISEGTETTRYISPLIGQLSRSNSITNCTTNVASVNSTSANIVYGGIVAYNSGAATITNCHTMATITLNSATTIKMGGIVGDANANVSCTSCSVFNKQLQLNSTGRARVGGIIGDGNSYEHTFNNINCIDTIAVHTITGRGDIGGLVGCQSDGATGNLVGSRCIISGRITASTNGTNTIYVGKVYGYGRIAGRYGITSSDYDASNLIIPDEAGNIKSGDPTGRH